MTSQFLLILLLFTSLLSIATAQTCYIRNGTDRNTLIDAGPDLYQPCWTKQAFSMCCRKGPGGVDACLGNGLCINKANDTYRESCTDKTWQSSSCLNLCFDPDSEHCPLPSPRSSHKHPQQN